LAVALWGVLLFVVQDVTAPHQFPFAAAEDLDGSYQGTASAVPDFPGCPRL
jgi:hypothetical protein